MTAEEYKRYSGPAKRRLTAALRRTWQLSPQEARTAATTVFARSSETREKKEGGGIYTIEVKRRMVGVLWFVIQDLRGFREAYVLDLFIHHTKRRCGFATAALRVLETVAKRASVSRICLNVFEHNSGAIKFYATNGFQTASRGLIKPLI